MKLGSLLVEWTSACIQHIVDAFIWSLCKGSSTHYYCAVLFGPCLAGNIHSSMLKVIASGIVAIGLCMLRLCSANGGLESTRQVWLSQLAARTS